MKFGLLSALSLAALSTLAVAPALGQESLVVVSNGGPIQKAAQEAFYAPYTAATGVKVVEDSWSQEYARLRSQADTGNIIWDVVEITYNNLALACDEGILEKVDWSKHLNVADFESAGGVHECGIPMTVVVNGIAYDGGVISDGPKTWQDFWNVEKWPGKRSMLSRPTVIVFALMADGVAPKDILGVLNSPGGVDRAFAKLDQLKPHIRWWKAGAEPIEMLVNKEVVMAQAWNGRVATAVKKDGRNLKMSYEGGVTGGNQYVAIMKGTKKLDRSIEFIKMASSAEPLGKYAEALLSMPANSKAAALLSPELQATLPTKQQMDAALLQLGDDYDAFWLANLDALTKRLAVWQAQ